MPTHPPTQQPPLWADDHPEPRRPGNPRVTGTEQFYTPPQVARDVVAHVLRTVPGAADRTWLEPAGGTGAFIEAALAAGVRDVVSVNVDPRHPAVTRGDFLTGRLRLTGAVAFGNPPFGRNNSLSVPFFNTAARHSDVIAFIVPRSWRKWSVANRLDRSFHLLTDTNVNVDYVDAAGRPIGTGGNLRTCAQLWERQPRLRPLVAVEDRGVVRKCAPADADVALTVFGYGCGTVSADFPRTRVSTRMYLRLVHPRALEALTAVDYGGFRDNVAYVQALAFPEINYLLNEYLFGDPLLTLAPGGPAAGPAGEPAALF